MAKDGKPGNGYIGLAIKVVSIAITLAAILVSITIAWSDNKEGITINRGQIEANKEQQTIVNVNMKEDLSEIKTDVREMLTEQRRLMGHLNVPAKK
jgi:hypothetical protein